MSLPYLFLKLLKRKRQAEQKQQSKSEAEIFDSKKCSFKCRICLKEGSVPIYATQGSPDLSEAVKSFGDIDLSEWDDHPKHLCEACHSLLQSAILFRKTAKETETILTQANIEPELPVELDTEESYRENEHHETSNITSKKFTSYKCIRCKLNFRTHKEWVTHKSSRQHRNVRIQCTVCHGMIPSQLYKKHVAHHNSSSFHLICEVCGKLYRKNNLLRHMQLHSFELPYQCQICPYRGRFMESLKLHMKSHTGEKPFPCDKCHLRFLTRSNLNRHLLTHKKDRPFQCVECGRGFYTQKNLDVHFKSNHSGIKDFECRVCGNKYGTRKALMRHDLRVHKREKNTRGRPLYLQSEYRKT